jgi:asparagine synthase (glutamine-hydrolysing)
MAARTAGQLKTFTVRFPSHSRYDETEHARLVARHFGTEHIELDAENATVDMLPRLARQFDEPIIDSSMIPTALISGLVKRHCTVALGGDGGDELFAGYRHYVGLLRLQQRSGLVPLGLRRVAARSAELLLPLGFRGRNWLQALGVDFDRGVPLIASYFDAGARRQLLPQRGAAVGAAEAGYKSRVPRGADLLQRAGRMDFQNYLAEDILVKTDRSSMMHSIELRTPMLDHRIVEFAFRKVPSSLKATPAVGKILLKKLAARVLPPEFDRQRKQGFSIPIASWLQRGPWHERFREVLLDSAQRIFDHGCVERLLQGQSRGRTNGERLFGLVMFELWRREYRVQI